jgi:hypothetical protein
MTTLDDVLFELILAEPRPTHEALCRWITLWPQFACELEDFFVAWSISDAFNAH